MALECARAERRGDTGTPSHCRHQLQTYRCTIRPLGPSLTTGSAATTCHCHRLLLFHLYNYDPCGPRVSPRDCTRIKAGDNRYHNRVYLHEPSTHMCRAISSRAATPPPREAYPS